MRTSKEDLKATLAAMTEETTDTVFFSDNSESIWFQMLPNTIIHVHDAPLLLDGHKYSVHKQIMDMCFMLTGDTVLPENIGSEYLQTFPVDETTIRDHVDALISYEVISNEAALLAFNDLRDTFNRSLGRYAGHLMRHYPAINDGVHPFTVASTPLADIPVNMIGNCADIWNHMSPDDRANFSDSIETYSKFVYCSAVDQLNRAMVSLKKGASSARISLSHPANLRLSAHGIKEQPILDRVAAYDYLDSLHFWVTPGTKNVTLQVKLHPSTIQAVYYQVLPMFSFLLSKVAADCELVPVALEITADLIYIESNQETRDLLTILVSDNACASMSIPDYVPSKPATDFTAADLINK